MKSLLLPLMLMLFCACAATTHRVVVVPVKDKLPVSASGFYLDGQGGTVTPTQYSIASHFKLAKTLTAPILEETTTELSLDADLTKLAAQHGGDAIVNVRLATNNYDPGPSGTYNVFRCLGWGWLGMGALWVPLGLAIDKKMLIGAGAFAGVGLLSILVSKIIQGSSVSTWEIGIEGDVVKRTGASPKASLVPTAPADATHFEGLSLALSPARTD